MDAGGKDGTIRHVFSGVNPQGVDVASFKQPTPLELAHDFLWRVHPQAPRAGQIVIFNRSHYEDVLVTRVHKLVDKKTCVRRYEHIRDFEALLAESGTTILKFFLHISKEEQLARFAQRLEDPARNWKISESDYSERELWDDYVDAYRGRDQRDQHDERAVVRDPLEPQVVSQSRGVADHRGHHGRSRPRLPGAVGQSRGDKAQVSCGRRGK